MPDLSIDSGLDGLTEAAASRAISGFVGSGVLVDTAGRIDQDIDCRICGYNLRRGDPDGVCPECGTAVGWSLEGDLLKFSDPDWVRKLAVGMGWLLSSIVAGFGIGCAGGAVAVAVGSAQGPWVVFAGRALSAVLSLVGYWLFTEPESVERFGEPVRVRLVARWGCVLSVVLGVVSAGIGMTEPIISLIVSVMGGIAGIVGFFGLFLYARRLALRIPDLSLAKQTQIVMWGLVVVMGFSIIAAAAMAVIGSGAGQGTSAGATFGRPTRGVLAAVGCVAGVGYLVFGIWVVVLLALYRSRFNMEAEHARRTWATRRAT